MKAKEIRARLKALEKQVTDAMDAPAVAHRLHLLVPGITQLEAVVDGIKSKIEAEREVAAKKSVKAGKAH